MYNTKQNLLTINLHINLFFIVLPMYRMLQKLVSHYI